MLHRKTKIFCHVFHHFSTTLYQVGKYTTSEAFCAIKNIFGLAYMFSKRAGSLSRNFVSNFLHLDWKQKFESFTHNK